MATVTPDMAKKQPARRPAADDGDFFVRLPKAYHPILQAMKARTGRAYTVSLQLAIERLARDMKIDFTPNWPELL